MRRIPRLFLARIVTEWPRKSALWLARRAQRVELGRVKRGARVIKENQKLITETVEFAEEAAAREPIAIFSVLR